MGGVPGANYSNDTIDSPNRDNELSDTPCHVHGTNICTHVDLFEKLCTQMAHNDPINPPTEEEKIDWFLDTVTEKTYESVHATCSDANITGTLTFNKLVKL